MSFEMPFLFLLSGYTAGYSYPNSKRGFLKRKLQRLLIPYLSWATIYYILECLFIDSVEISIEGFVFEIFTSAFWFLRELFLIYALLWLCKQIVELFTKHMSKLVSVIVIFSIVPIAFIFSKIPILSESFSPYYCAWFSIGYMLYQLFKSNVIMTLWFKTKDKTIMWIGIFCLAILFVILGLKSDLSEK